MQTMCLCMPLQLGTLLTAGLQVLISFLYVVDRPFFSAFFRPFTGGYALSSAIAVGAVEVSGLIFGLVGVLGAWNTKRRYVATYNYWQFARLVVWVYVFVVDIPLLFHCEDWVNNVEKATDRMGWNQVMFDIAMSASCPHERVRFLVLSLIAMVVFMYLVFATSRYIEFLDRSPRHLLRVPKDLSSGIFYAKPMGDRSYLDEGEEEYGTFGIQQDPFGHPSPGMCMGAAQQQPPNVVF